MLTIEKFAPESVERCTSTPPYVTVPGELIDAHRAHTYGLVHRVHPTGTVVDSGYGLVARIAAGAPLVNRWHKQFIRRLLERRPLTEEERGEAHEAFETRDYVEGRTAFVEKRDPDFTGE